MRKLMILLAAATLLYVPACSDKNPGEEEIVPPTLTTNAAKTIYATGATLGGNVTNAGKPAFVERGVCYGTTENPTVSNNRTPVEGVETGTFETEVMGLTPKTTYHVRAYVNTPNGVVYGDDVVFETLEAGEIAVQPILTTVDATNITPTSVTLGGNITGAGTPEYTERGVCYAKSQNPEVNNGKMTSKGTGIGTFEVNLTGLESNTTYYARAYVICAGTPCYGNEVQFVTSNSTGQTVIAILLDTKAMELEVTKKETLTFSIIPSTAGNKKVTWSSNNPAVATVDPATGEITALKSGTATITVTTDDGGLTDDCIVTVVGTNLLLNPGFEDPNNSSNPDDDQQFLPTGWTSVPEEWFESYYGIASTDITPAQIAPSSDVKAGWNVRAPLSWFTTTYSGMNPALTGKFSARIPSGTATAGTGGLYQVVSVTPGVTYEYGCDIAFRDNNGKGAGVMNPDMAVKILTADGNPLLNGGNQIGITYLGDLTAVTTGTANLQYFYINRPPDYTNGVKGTVTIPAGVTQVRFQVDQRNDHAVSDKWSAVMVWDQCFVRKLE